MSDLITPIQRGELRAVQRRVHLSDHQLDQLAEQRFRSPVDALTWEQAQQLITESYGWLPGPAETQRAQGQQDLFELPS